MIFPNYLCVKDKKTGKILFEGEGLIIFHDDKQPGFTLDASELIGVLGEQGITLKEGREIEIQWGMKVPID